ncbi:MAG TPA: CocE/NonD family hydrolase [Alphaproteobacteria bacterium]|nr:CocE/NonD family hydrolase [Alphaproteobacteria bacterium]
MAEDKLYEVEVKTGVAMKMRDGVELQADIYTPKEDGEYPVLLLRLPYDKTVAEVQALMHPEWYARHGYIVVSQDTRGRGASGGEFRPFHDECNDGVDTIKACVKLKKSNGKVGTYGFSYPGQTQLLSAVKRPKGFTTMIPALTSDGVYDDWTFKNGVLHQAFVQGWAAYLSIGEVFRKGKPAEVRPAIQRLTGICDSYDHLPLTNHPDLPKKYNSFYYEWLKHPTYDAYWKKWQTADKYGEIDVPALHIGGWYDIFVEGNIRNYLGLKEGAKTEEARAGQKLVIGPWYHMPWTQAMGEMDFGPEARNRTDELALRWFDHWMRGVDNGIMDEPPISVFVMGANKWRQADEWPLKNTNFTKFYMHSGGHANSLNGDGMLTRQEPGEEPHDIYVADPGYPVPSLGGRSCCLAAFAPMGPMDQRPVETRNDVLVFTSAPLAQDVAVIGPVDATLYAASSADDTDFTVKLVDVYPDGRAINIVDAIQRASHRESSEKPSAIKPGKVYEYSFRVGSTAIRFAKGHRIRVEIASSNFPTFERHLNKFRKKMDGGYYDGFVATQRFFHDSQRPSHITLPLVPAA